MERISVMTIRWIEKLVCLCTDNISRLVVLPVHMKPPKKVLSIILSLQQAKLGKTTKQPSG